MKNNSIKIIVTLLVGFFSANTFAQDFNWENLNEQSNRLQGKLSGKVYFMPAEEGSRHFYHEGWPEGSILMEDGDRFENIRLQYLAYGDELVAYNAHLSQLFVVDKEKVAAFTVHLPQRKQEFIKMYFDGFEAGDRYFELLYKGSRQLLAFHSVDEAKTGIYKDKRGRRKHTVLKLTSNYYMYSGEMGFKKMQPKRRSFLNLFPGQKKEVRRLFRRNNLSRFNENEMVRAFEILEKAGFF